MKIIDEVKDAKSIGIGGHLRPDGDCVGSVMGLYLYLTKALPDVRVDVYLEKPADIFDCIRDVDKIRTDLAADMTYDVFIAMDCNAERLGPAETMFQKAGKRINIDNHISTQCCGDINILDQESSSTCELL